MKKFTIVREGHGQSPTDELNDLDFNNTLFGAHSFMLHFKSQFYQLPKMIFSIFWHTAVPSDSRDENGSNWYRWLTTIDYEESAWGSTTLPSEKAIEITNAKTYVFADSVLCLGSISDQPVKHSNKMTLGNWRRIELFESHWNSSGKYAQDALQSSRRIKICRLNWSVNLSNSKARSPSDQRTTTLCGKNEERRKMCLQIVDGSRTELTEPRGNLSRQHEHKFAELHGPEKLIKLSYNTRLMNIEKRQFFQMRIHVEHTSLRIEETSCVRGWILGKTKIDSVLGCERLQDFTVSTSWSHESLFRDRTFSWVWIENGIDKYAPKRQNKFLLKTSSTESQGNLLRKHFHDQMPLWHCLPFLFLFVKETG